MNIALILNIALISKDLEYFLNNFTHKNLWFSMNQKFRNKPGVYYETFEYILKIL